MSKLQVGDRVQMPGVPFVVEVLELGVCDDPDCHFDGSVETFRVKDPQSGEDDWMHSAEFERVDTPVIAVFVDEAADVLSEEGCEQRLQEIITASRKQEADLPAGTVKAYASDGNWCVYCPDTIQPGEAEITDPELEDPFGEPGHAHADCAEANGWTADEDRTAGDDVPDVRERFRRHIREHGPIELEL